MLSNLIQVNNRTLDPTSIIPVVSSFSNTTEMHPFRDSEAILEDKGRDEQVLPLLLSQTQFSV
jgi:hypothetical protein